jgi:hypothetical protein
VSTSVSGAVAQLEARVEPRLAGAERSATHAVSAVSRAIDEALEERLAGDGGLVATLVAAGIDAAVRRRTLAVEDECRTAAATAVDTLARELRAKHHESLRAVSARVAKRIEEFEERMTELESGVREDRVASMEALKALMRE